MCKRNNGFFEQHITSSNGQAEKAILGEALTIHYFHCICENRNLILGSDIASMYAEQGQGNQALGFCRTATMRVDWVSSTRDSA
jgi:hypothetical protein